MPQQPSNIKPIVILAIPVVLLGIGLVWFANQTPNPSTNAPAANESGRVAAAPTATMKTYADETPTVKIDVQYPHVDGLLNIEQAEMLNGELEHLAISTTDEFSREVAETASPDPMGSKSTITIRYETALLTHGVMSVRYDISVYSAGAAHPNLFYKTLNWDIVHAAEIRTDDLFVNEADWITRFSALAIADLESQFADGGDDFEALSTDIRQGAGPKAENFTAWTMDRSGITLHFEPYQVAAYAAGPQHVKIPWKELAAMLDPDAFAVQHVVNGSALPADTGPIE